MAPSTKAWRALHRLWTAGKLTQPQLAGLAGTNQSTACRWLNRQQRPGPVQRARLSAALGLDEADWLTASERRELDAARHGA